MPFDRREEDRRKREQRLADQRSQERRQGPEMAGVAGEPISVEDINQLRSHIEYEMWMIKETVDYLTRHGQRIGESNMNAYLESFLLHAVTMVNFYFPPGRDQIQDFVANDFIPNWSDNVDLSDKLARIRESADRGLGRLSYRSLELPTKKNLAIIYTELEALRSRFETLLKTQEEPQKEE